VLNFAIIDSARDGEHTKCNIFGFAILVPSKSAGVKRIRGVLYSKLTTEFQSTETS
jgi:hypothetical protein